MLDGYDEQYISSLLAILNTLAVKIHEWMPILKVERPVQPRDYDSDVKPDPPDHQKLAVKVEWAMHVGENIAILLIVRQKLLKTE